MKNIFVIPALLSLFATLAANAQKQVLPINDEAKIEDTYTIIWNGLSKAYRFTNGEWVRDETYDYVFNVIQKRYPNVWKSTKTLHRQHSGYDGKAGDRSQSMYFELNYQRQGDALTSILHSSLGDGQGKSDREFREQVLEFKVDNMSRFAPYDHLRITQHYKYEEGVLEELVELYKLKDGKEIPFMKNEEKAYFYIKGKLNEAPTKM